MTNSNDKEKTTPPSTTRFAMGSNDVNSTPMEFCFKTFESEHLLYQKESFLQRIIKRIHTIKNILMGKN
jgi:hypothetical protein